VVAVAVVVLGADLAAPEVAAVVSVEEVRAEAGSSFLLVSGPHKNCDG